MSDADERVIDAYGNEDTLGLGVVILAAGAGTRLGGKAKALLPFGNNGENYLGWILFHAYSAGAIRTQVVVVGPPHDERIIRQVLDDHEHVHVVRNPDPSRGMASSVALGFAELERVAKPHVESAYLWPVDHPFVLENTLRQLFIFRAGNEVCVPRYQGRGGHPPLIARSVWPALAACADNPGGARAVLAERRATWIDVDDPGVVRDIDTPEDLAEAQKR
ncbi:MAG: NTP transferase domain-containing protein [Kofleriaceae bacterium]